MAWCLGLFRCDRLLRIAIGKGQFRYNSTKITLVPISGRAPCGNRSTYLVLHKAAQGNGLGAFSPHWSEALFLPKTLFSSRYPQPHSESTVWWDQYVFTGDIAELSPVYDWRSTVARICRRLIDGQSAVREIGRRYPSSPMSTAITSPFICQLKYWLTFHNSSRWHMTVLPILATILTHIKRSGMPIVLLRGQNLGFLYTRVLTSDGNFNVDTVPLRGRGVSEVNFRDKMKSWLQNVRFRLRMLPLLVAFRGGGGLGVLAYLAYQPPSNREGLNQTK